MPPLEYSPPDRELVDRIRAGLTRHLAIHARPRAAQADPRGMAGTASLAREPDAAENGEDAARIRQAAIEAFFHALRPASGHR